ncbi:SDR family NAD(P)-dependent oxidoreductase [Horticoccus sp. 23ND18S-11]|uniref:SDR family NAD(P)-dependent oxidoreductase n=1 Tax=Horticoccus sp. 23ND18S-11 TaxID=3391832 RepID=UPI0039C9FAC5
MSLREKVIIVTGGSSGIGEACSRHLAQLGARVVIASNQRESGEALAADLRAGGRNVQFVYTDVAQEESVQALMRRTVELHGRIDGVHCNAGVWAQGKVTDFNEAVWNKVMNVNVKSVFWTAKHVLPVMERQGKGVIVITTSVAAFVGFPAHALYCASKAALESLIRSLAVDHAGWLRVAGVCPGTIDTPMLAATCAGWDKPVQELYADVARRIPVRRLGQPIDIAHAVAFLLGDEAGYINGTSIVLDGGTLALPPW